MDTQPWDYWEQNGVTPKGHAPEIVSTLESIIKRDPDHPGRAPPAYIHAVKGRDHAQAGGRRQPIGWSS